MNYQKYFDIFGFFGWLMWAFAFGCQYGGSDKAGKFFFIATMLFVASLAMLYLDWQEGKKGKK